MNYQEKIFRFRVAVGIVLQRLRKNNFTDEKSMTQNSLNDNILLKYKKAWNSAREESLPNTRLDTLYMISDYFNISMADLFKRVDEVSKKEIDQEIKSKTKLQRLYKELNR